MTNASTTESLLKHMNGESAASEVLFKEVYAELRRIAGNLMKWERPEHTLEPTALVHEAYLRLVDGRVVSWKGRAHFCGVAAEAMRRILIEHARARGADKRGGGWQRQSVNDVVDDASMSADELIAIAEAVEALAVVNHRAASVASMRVFSGHSHAETAIVLGVSERSIAADWKFARSWLANRLG